MTDLEIVADNLRNHGIPEHIIEPLARTALCHAWHHRISQAQWITDATNMALAMIRDVPMYADAR